MAIVPGDPTKGTLMRRCLPLAAAVTFEAACPSTPVGVVRTDLA